MTEAEALTQIAYWLQRIFVELAGISVTLVFMLMFKDMGGKK